MPFLVNAPIALCSFQFYLVRLWCLLGANIERNLSQKQIKHNFDINICFRFVQICFLNMELYFFNTITIRLVCLIHQHHSSKTVYPRHE